MAAAWYVGRASWRRRWQGILLLGLVAGIVGGAVLGALAGARRTATAYDRLTNASQAPHVVMFVLDGYDEVAAWLEDVPSVDHFERAAGMIGRRSPQQDWYSLDAPYDSVGLGTPVLDRGRLPDPDRADEVLITLRTARNTGLDIGDVLDFHAYAREQGGVINDDPWTVPEGPRIRAEVVGISRDPTDAQLSQTIKIVFGTPTFAKQYGSEAASDLVAIWLDDTPGADAAFQRDAAEFASTSDSAPFNAVSSAADEDAADHASRAVVTGLLIFALVAGLAGIVTIGQALRRYLARADDQQEALLALGTPRADRAAAQLISALPFLVFAPVVAVFLAYAISPAFPLGAARSLEPSPGLHADPLVLVIGGIAWLLLLALITFAAVWFGNSRATSETRGRAKARTPGGGANTAALPAAIGLTFALSPGARRRTLQRTAVFGVIVAIAGAVGSVLFVASLDDFTASSERYGLPYDVTLEMPNGQSRSVLDRLAANADLEAVAGARGGTVELEGRIVDAYAIAPVKGAMSPTMESGRVPTGESEIALGPKLLDNFGKELGDTVVVATDGAEQELTIVGTAYAPMPESAGFNSEVVLAPDGFDAYANDLYVQAIARVRPEADVEAVIADLDDLFPYAVSDESLPHAPGPVRNIEQVARLPSRSRCSSYFSERRRSPTPRS